MDLGDFFGLLVFLAFVILPALGRRAKRQTQRAEPRPDPAPSAPRPVAFPAPPPPPPRRPAAPVRPLPQAPPATLFGTPDTEDWTREGGDQTPEQLARHAEALGRGIAFETQDLDDDRRIMAQRASRLGSLQVGGHSVLGPGLRTELADEPPVPDDDVVNPPAPGYFSSRDELRRAVVMAEILGRPRARRRLSGRR